MSIPASLNDTDNESSILDITILPSSNTLLSNTAAELYQVDMSVLSDGKVVKMKPGNVYPMILVDSIHRYSIEEHDAIMPKYIASEQ